MRVEAGDTLATLFAEDEGRFAEPEHLLREALTIGEEATSAPALVREIISADNKDSYLKKANRP